MRSIAMILCLLCGVANAQSPALPLPTAEQQARCVAVISDPAADAKLKGDCKLIMARVDESIKGLIACGLPEAPKSTAVCAVEFDGYPFSLKMRDECCEAAAKGQEASNCKKSVRALLVARKQTEAAKAKGMGIIALPPAAKRPEECLIGSFSAADREACCAPMGRGAVLCGLAVEMLEAQAAAAAEVECK
ncbi:MAG: hypothetical protein KBD15_00655 [Candidatus Magasanikbacteria bacterium]|jgi:hypothetical protein|nr:hypothetical protein [Candidatus Magasanikbacteria bacterium]